MGSRWIMRVDIQLVIVLRKSGDVDVGILHMKLRLALITLWRLLINFLDIYKVFRHILAVLEILLEQLVVLRCFKSCLLVGELVWRLILRVKFIIVRSFLRHLMVYSILMHGQGRAILFLRLLDMCVKFACHFRLAFALAFYANLWQLLLFDGYCR